MRVAIALMSSSGFAEGALRGIAAYARPHKPWTFDHGPQSISAVRSMLARRPDGFLISTEDPEVCELLNQERLPIVNLHYVDCVKHAARVSNDDRAIGALAAQHLLSRGYRRFAYYVCVDQPLDQRLSGFQAELRLSGYSCEAFPGGPPYSPDLTQHEADLEPWLLGLEKPVAIFCAHDNFARIVSESCRRVGIPVPGQAAILGVDNDTAICGLADPPLSSVQIGSVKIGFEAAKLLDDLMSGKAIANAPLMIPPIRVIARRSTDAVASDDSLVTDTLTLMRENLDGTGGIELLCKKLHTTRRTLERRFREAFSMTPAQAWARFRLEEAQRLLSETDIKLSAVAQLSGFGEAKYLWKAFRRMTGQTPGEFRALSAPQLQRVEHESGEMKSARADNR